MWKCKGCAETNDDSFDSCWKCGTGKDGSPPPKSFAVESAKIADIAERAMTDPEGAGPITGALGSVYHAMRPEPLSAVPEGSVNKVSRVSLKGGLLGLFANDPHRTLSAAIAKENRDGWKVIQVIPDDTGNIFIMVVRFVILIITVFLYTPANGYWVIMERVPKLKK